MILETFFSHCHGEELERIACPSCDADDAEVYRVAHDRLFGLPGPYSVVKCRRCDMAYTNPRPSFGSLGRHYPNDYFCYDTPQSLEGFRGLVLRRVIRDLVTRRLRLLERATGRLSRGTTVCDVGCSHGQLLAAMKARRSCDVMGVDFNRDMVEHCRRAGVPAVSGTLEEASFDDEQFDVVTMTEYLEHEGRPRDVLRECRRITKPGGYIAIEVPMISTWGARLFKNYWSQLDLPRHLMFFTPQTLGSMLRESGYEVVSVNTLPGSIGMSMLHLLGYERIGRMTALDIILTILVTIPLLPLLPFLRVFMFVVARATPPAGREAEAERPSGIRRAARFGVSPGHVVPPTQVASNG